MIYINCDKICVQKHKKILKVSDNEIVFIKDSNTIFIVGENMVISYFEKDEFHITGKFLEIKFND